MKKWFRKLHRWLGLLMAVQIIAWMISGLYFAWFPIEEIRGEHLAAKPASLTADDLEGIAPAFEAWRAFEREKDPAATLESISLVKREGRAWYRLTAGIGEETVTRLVDARTVTIRPQLDDGEARSIAAATLNVPGKVQSVEAVTEMPAGAEYRGRSLPLWRVRYAEPESLNVYIDAWTGEVVARRTAKWRVFDFLWMLHIMDFDERDDFNTPLLQAAAALGLILALTGLFYWTLTTRLFRKRPAGGG